MYSLYLHLSNQGVLVNIGDQINEGQLIAQSDDSGNSYGAHLHLQIVIHPQSDRTLTTLDSENRSRNPELWLNPYNGNTGTVIGKVTNVNGDEIGGVLVYGLQKQASWGYGSSLTYNNAALKQDDILVENWGTTDVTPGHYHVTTSAGGDLGWHDVVAGQVTYVGLFPVWLPYMLGNSSGWNSAIIVRNNSGTYRAQVNTTYFNMDGTVNQQTQTFIPTNATATLTPPGGFVGSAIVVSSEDIGVVVENRNSLGYGYAYTGQSAPTSLEYLPQILQHLNTVWHTTVQAMNTGVLPTNITTNFYDQYGTGAGTTTVSNLAVNGSSDVAQPMPSGNSLYVGRMSAAQPVASVVRVSDNSDFRRLGYTGVPVADTTVWLPFVMTRLGNDWGATVWIQNTSSTNSTVYLDFYQNGGRSGGGSETLPGNGLAAINLRTDYARYGLPAGWSGSAKVSANVPVAGVVNQLNDSANLGASYEGIPHSAGSTTVILPDIVRRPADAPCYYSNFTVRNLGSVAANVRIGYYTETGYSPVTVTDNGIASERIYNLYTSAPADLPQNFRGSVVIVSTNNQPLAATSNMLYYASPSCTGRDDTISYTGVNR